MKVLFVCAGNTCRSPFAERLARKLAAQRGLDAEFASAGAVAAHGDGPPADAVAIAHEFDVDLGGHRSQPLTRTLEQDADVVRTLFHLPDPIGRGPDAYRECYGLVLREVTGVLDELAGNAR